MSVLGFAWVLVSSSTLDVLPNGGVTYLVWAICFYFYLSKFSMRFFLGFTFLFGLVLASCGVLLSTGSYAFYRLGGRYASLVSALSWIFLPSVAFVAMVMFYVSPKLVFVGPFSFSPASSIPTFFLFFTSNDFLSENKLPHVRSPVRYSRSHLLDVLPSS